MMVTIGSARGVLAAAAIFILAAPVAAADLSQGYNQCIMAAGSSLMSQPDNARLTDDVVRLMNESVAVAEDSRWIYSNKAAFIWASEAKAACGKAFGYLKSNYRDEEMINKCDCFHARMIQYMH
jgi:hypothetical protein